MNHHHIRNALVQVRLADHLADRQLQHELLQKAIERVSHTLYRVSTGEDVALLLDHLTGTDLATTGSNSAECSHAE